MPESLRLEGGRLVRRGVDFEMNAYCRRAVSQGVRMARDTGGSCTVLTLGPPSAEDVVREAVAWGADTGLHLCDPAFAGSDTLATARALAAALTVFFAVAAAVLGAAVLVVAARFAAGRVVALASAMVVASSGIVLGWYRTN